MNQSYLPLKFTKDNGDKTLKLLPLKYLLFPISTASSLIQAVFSPRWCASLPHHLASPHSSFKIHRKPHVLHLVLSGSLMSERPWPLSSGMPKSSVLDTAIASV